jgi:hypothetical protein
MINGPDGDLQSYRNGVGTRPQLSDRRRAWLGGKNHPTDLRSGVVTMGVRAYVPISVASSRPIRCRVDRSTATSIPARTTQSMASISTDACGTPSGPSRTSSTAFQAGGTYAWQGCQTLCQRIARRRGAGSRRLHPKPHRRGKTALGARPSVMRRNAHARNSLDWQRKSPGRTQSD